MHTITFLLALTLGMGSPAPEPAHAPASQDQKAAPKGSSPEADPAKGLNDDKAALRAKGYLKLGTVRFHPGRKEVEADGYFNLRQGFIEFLACHPRAKAHETLIALDCKAEHLNAALLLLGKEPGKGPKSELDLLPIEGPRMMIFLRWTEKDAEGKPVVVTRRAEDCILNGLVEDTIQHAGWVYTGSEWIEEPAVGPGGGAREDAPGTRPPSVNDKPVVKDKSEPAPGSGKTATGETGDDLEPAKTREVFGAAATGQLIALSHRPFAILDNPLAIPFPDGDYYAYPDMLPNWGPDDGPPSVTVVIRLPKPGEIDPKAYRMRIPPPPKKESAAEGEDAAKDDDASGSSDGKEEKTGKPGQ